MSQLNLLGKDFNFSTFPPCVTGMSVIKDVLFRFVVYDSPFFRCLGLVVFVILVFRRYHHLNF